MFSVKSMYNVWVLIDSYSGIDAACGLSLPCACSWAFERQSETLQRLLCPSWPVSVLQYRTAQNTHNPPGSLCMSSLSRLPLHTPHSCMHHCDQSVSVPSCLLSSSAWLQTTLVFLVRAQTPIWAVPLVACERGLFSACGHLPDAAAAVRDDHQSGFSWQWISPHCGPHLLKHTLASGGSLNNFQTIKNFRDMKEILHPSVLQSSLLFCFG